MAISYNGTTPRRTSPARGQFMDFRVGGPVRKKLPEAQPQQSQTPPQIQLPQHSQMHQELPRQNHESTEQNRRLVRQSHEPVGQSHELARQGLRHTARLTHFRHRPMSDVTQEPAQKPSMHRIPARQVLKTPRMPQADAIHHAVNAQNMPHGNHERRIDDEPLQDMKIPEPERTDDGVESVEFGLVEELDMHARHPQARPNASRVTNGPVLLEKTETEANAGPEKPKRRKLPRLKYPFLKSVNVEKRPLSETATAATAVAATGLGRASLGKASFNTTGGLKATVTGIGEAEKVGKTDAEKKSLLKVDGKKKEKSHAVGPTVIVSQGNKLRSNIGLGIAVTLTVLVGGVVGAFIYLAFFQ